MKWIKKTGLFFLFSLVCLLQNRGTAGTLSMPFANETSSFCSVSLLETKGIIEPVLEIGGLCYQQSFHKQKKYGSGSHSFHSGRHTPHLSKIALPLSLREHPSVPRFLFNRSILI